ncbi:SpaH/EbpB family LPXTG-anchored major pilin [uncultured Dubosiella sp.]|uniref:SpaH/EbpB family LPXTG-anchored major pilin n=1 Tax=uncultured Dubosiella sp. TaxID=1937011 RepID=UPI0025B5CD66|nr:SpaH/EbpB family LPXTG-anchored major pilin [uncultured Dubosiella sp.]
MKSLKKLLSIFAAFMMVVGLTAANVKAEGTETTGSITINNAVVGETYNVYKIFSISYLDSASDEGVAYYATKAVKEWFETNSPTYFSFQETKESDVYAVKAKGILDAKSLSETLRTAVGKPPFTAVQSSVTATTNTVVFNDLTVGYYYVSSSLGSLVTINTAKPDVTIQDKNTDGVPTKPDKEISNNDNTVQIGSTVPFKVTTSFGAGTQKLVFKDKMSNGLTFNANSPAIKLGEVTYNLVGSQFTNGNTVLATLDTISTSDYTFKINFEDSTIKSLTDSLTGNEKLSMEVTYSATVNSEAATTNKETNEVTIDYGNNGKVESDIIPVYKGQLTVYKYTGDLNGTHEALAGAIFKLYDANNQEVKVKGENGVYVVSSDPDENTVTELVSNAQGKITVSGLDAGTYTLKETKAPDGYTLSYDTVDFTIAAGDNTIVKHADVENVKGSSLPSTGGMGTTMLYVAGAILMVGAAVIFVTNKRMKHE